MAEIVKVFTEKDFTEGYKAMPFTIKGSFYKNVFPQNLLYNQGNGIFSGDCWNTFKAYVWSKGVLPKNKGEYWYNPGLYGLGDWTGRQILNHCYDVSSDFSKINHTRFLLNQAEDHAGIYVGDFNKTINGVTRTYNVIETTPIWANGIQATYVDAQGRRFQYKGGPQSSAWKYHGMIPWLDYGEEKQQTVVVEKAKKMKITTQTDNKIVIELVDAN